LISLRILAEAWLEVTGRRGYTKDVTRQVAADRRFCLAMQRRSGNFGTNKKKHVMQVLIELSRRIDRMSGWLGHTVSWLIVVAVCVSAGNAIVRKVFDISSNAWLEAQWWLFALVFLLAAPWTLRDNEHIRIDVVNARLSQGTRNIIELIGHVFFLLPMAAMLAWTSWHYAAISLAQHEGSQNAGGLPQWPIKMLIPLAFALLFVQGVSELIKRIAIMRGLGDSAPHDHTYHQTVSEAGMPERDKAATERKPVISER
jgi:TRAP-type mannitol/chloroaromatic compound transport system permease small subunit